MNAAHRSAVLALIRSILAEADYLRSAHEDIRLACPEYDAALQVDRVAAAIARLPPAIVEPRFEIEVEPSHLTTSDLRNPQSHRDWGMRHGLKG